MSYALLTTLGLSPQNTLLVMLFIPVLMAITFWVFIREDHKEDETNSPLISEPDDSIVNSSGYDGSGDGIRVNAEPTPELTYYEMAVYIKVVIYFIDDILITSNNHFRNY